MLELPHWSVSVRGRHGARLHMSTVFCGNLRGCHRVQCMQQLSGGDISDCYRGGCMSFMCNMHLCPVQGIVWLEHRGDVRRVPTLQHEPMVVGLFRRSRGWVPGMPNMHCRKRPDGMPWRDEHRLWYLRAVWLRDVQCWRVYADVYELPLGQVQWRTGCFVQRLCRGVVFFGRGERVFPMPRWFVCSLNRGKCLPGLPIELQMPGHGDCDAHSMRRRGAVFGERGKGRHDPVLLRMYRRIHALTSRQLHMSAVPRWLVFSTGRELLYLQSRQHPCDRPRSRLVGVPIRMRIRVPTSGKLE